jgi:hypothetical protein
MWIPRGFVCWFLAALILLFGARCARTYRVFNDTIDESAHIAAGLEIWENHRYTAENQHPPLGRMVVGLPAYLAGLRQSEEQRRADLHTLWKGSSPEFYWRTLTFARLGNLIYVPFLLVYVYRWGSQLYGTAAGLGAATLASLCPNLLAHASLATIDFAAATAIFVSAYYCWLWSRDPTLRNCILVAVSFAIASVIKFSALVFIPAIAAGFFMTGWLERADQSPVSWKAILQRGALVLSVFGGVIWGAYFFDVGALPPADIPPVPGTTGQYIESAIEIATSHGKIPLPAPRFFRGVLELAAINAYGHPSYLLGRISQFGWWYYFLVVLAVKTTLPMLVLVGITLLTCLAGGRRGAMRAVLYPLLAAALILLICMSSRIDLGIRYILAIYPFLALIAGSLFAGVGNDGGRDSQVIAIAAFALLAWHAAESVRAQPDYLAYFNQIARGREDHFLLDSNLDWGQDLERLRQYQERSRIALLHLSYFGRTRPENLGMQGVRPLDIEAAPSGWVAISRNHIAGIGLSGHAAPSWPRSRNPVAQIGKSILVYRFPGE